MFTLSPNPENRNDIEVNSSSQPHLPPIPQHSYWFSSQRIRIDKMKLCWQQLRGYANRKNFPYRFKYSSHLSFEASSHILTFHVNALNVLY